MWHTIKTHTSNMFVALYLMLTLITQTSSTNETSSPALNALLELMTRTEETCGKLQWCTVQTGNYMDEDENECCHRCFCDLDSFRTESCCPDISLSRLLNGMVFDNVQDIVIELRNPDTIQMFDDTIIVYDHSKPTTDAKETVNCISSSIVDARHIWQKRPSYQMISSCSNETTNHRIKSLCQSPELDPGNPLIADHVPLQSWSTGLVYRNRYCALCNGIHIDGLTEWDIYVATKAQYIEFSDNHFSSIKDMIIHLLKWTMSVIYFEPNDKLYTSHPLNVCQSFDVETCNTESQIKQSTIDACHKYALPVYRQENGNLTVFKNLACLVCNGHDMAEPDTCRTYQPWETRKPFTVRIQGEHIVHGDSSAETEQNNKLDVKFSTRCEAGQLYDTRLDSCRQIYCPCMMVVYESKCVPMFQDVYDRFFEVYVDIPKPVVPKGDIEAVFQAGLYQYFINVFEKSNSFTAQNIIIWVQKENNPVHKSFIAYVIFSGPKQHSLFPDAIKFVDQHFRGSQNIKLLSTSIKMTVANYLIMESSNIAVNLNTRSEYKKTLALSDQPVSKLKLLRLTECHFCYHVEMLQQEVRDDYIYANFATNLTGQLACVDTIISNTDKETDHKAHDNVRTAVSVPAEDTTDAINEVDMLFVIVFIVLFVCFIIAVKVCLRKFGRYQTSQNSQVPVPRTNIA